MDTCTNSKWLRVRAIMLIGAMLMTFHGTAGAQPYTGKSTWLASWYAAQHDYNIAFPNNIVPPPPPITIADQTVRQIVRTSVGGSWIRVKVSNLMGTTPVTFDAAHIARSTGEDRIDPASQQMLRFNGTPSVTLAPGEERWSDGVRLNVATQGELAISLYLARPTPVITAHSIALQTNYLSSGNHTTAVQFSNPATLTSYFWLTAIDVAGHAPTARTADTEHMGSVSLVGDSERRANVVVAFGDSITDGAGSTLDANFRWPNLLDDRMQAVSSRLPASVVNAGIAGNRWIHDGVGPSGVTRFGRDVLGVTGTTRVIVLLGINDIGIGRLYPPQNVTAEQIIGALQDVVAQARKRRVKIYLGTLLPYGGAAYFDAAGEVKRQAVNHYIRQASGVDGIIDFDRALRNPINPTAMLPLYDSGDHLHPSDAGHRAMADAVYLPMLMN